MRDWFSGAIGGPSLATAMAQPPGTVLASIETAVPGAALDITGVSGPDPRSYRVDFSSIRSALPQFEARWSVADGATELSDRYRTLGLTSADFADRFVRLATLTRRLDEGTLTTDLRPVARPLATQH